MTQTDSGDPLTGELQGARTLDPQATTVRFPHTASGVRRL